MWLVKSFFSRELFLQTKNRFNCYQKYNFLLRLFHFVIEFTMMAEVIVNYLYLFFLFNIRIWGVFIGYRNSLKLCTLVYFPFRF